MVSGDDLVDGAAHRVALGVETQVDGLKAEPAVGFLGSDLSDEPPSWPALELRISFTAGHRHLVSDSRPTNR